jgi:endoglucanase
VKPAGTALVAAVVTASVFGGCVRSRKPLTPDSAPPQQADAGVDGRSAPAMPGVNVPAIKVDTVGYEPSWRKIAIFNVDPTGARVEEAGSGRPVATITPAQVSHRGIDRASQDPVWQVDFSSLREPGSYRLAVGDARSDAFRIESGVYGRALVAGAKSFYFQRCRTALAAPSAVWEGRDYPRAGVCHAHPEVGWDIEAHPHKKRRFRLRSGWHDAGNYDMYVPSTAVAVLTLLLAYEWAPGRFADGALQIPESGNRVPDLLDEVRYGLDWVLSLQEPSGAFRHSETVNAWTPPVPPNEDRTVRWVAQRSSSATAKAVAALAVAARLLGGWDRAFAARCRSAAHRGWAFLRAHPQHIRAARKGGGAQPLWDDEPGRSDTGARFAAAVEMWRSFRTAGALASARGTMANAEETRDPVKILDGAWANISRLALWTLATDQATAEEIRVEAARRLRATVQNLRPRVEKDDGYRCASATDDYFWASNSNLMEKVILLVMAARLAEGADRAWMVEAARDQWHWILGRNPNGYSMVTRVGKGPDRLYHMEWGPHEPPPPGYLIDGPNADNAGWLAPGAPAKALLWDNPRKLRSGLPPHSLWHWQQTDLWDGGFLKENDWSQGWWTVVEPDILYSANFVAAGAGLSTVEP